MAFKTLSALFVLGLTVSGVFFVMSSTHQPRPTITLYQTPT